MKEIIERRLWFDAHWKDIDTELSPWKILTRIFPLDVRSRYTCPCCGYPTLERRIMWEICFICWWEDDGQDDADKENVRGINQLALVKARSNFAENMLSFNRKDERFIRIGEATQTKRKKLVNAFEEIRKSINKLREIKQSIKKPEVTKLHREITRLLKNAT